MTDLEPTDTNIILSPLADPVFGAIYANAEVAGLAMDSFISAVLETENESLAGKIKSITPQQVHTSPRRRSCRVDVESDTYENENVVTEVQTEGKTIREVLAMSQALQDYANKDAGFQQFCDRYSFVSADPNTRKEYVLWANERMREAGEKEWAYNEGVEQGIEQGIEKGIKTVAIKMLKRNRSLDEVIEDTGLSFEEVKFLYESLQDIV